MVKKYSLLRYQTAIAALAAFTFMRPVSAVNDEQLESIRVLGHLNGIALHCNALPETQRIKRALVLNLPKRRQLGEYFEYETNNSFMAFIQEDGQCPSPASLTQQVDEALERLESVYATQ